MIEHRPHRPHRPPRPAVGHSHRLPSWLLVGLAIIVLGLVGSIVLVSAQATATNNRLTALEEYVAGKGHERDAENARQDQRIDAAICDLLDQLPQGGLLDRPRQKYGCGPGLPPTAAAAIPGAFETRTPASPTTARLRSRGTGPAPATNTTTSSGQPPSPSASPSPAATTSSAPAPASATSPPPAPQPALCATLPLLCPGGHL